MRYFDYLIGGHKVRLPENHDLPDTQASHKRYDFSLGELARIVSKKYPDSARIDIGANVGDSWALMNKHTISDTLLIEGDPDYWGLLDFNVDRLGHPARICKAFCAAYADLVPQADIVRDHGTSSIRKQPGRQGEGGQITDQPNASIQALTFPQILDLYPNYQDSKLIKLDTDGYDFGILKSNAALFSEMSATLFYECAPYAVAEGLREGMRESIESFSELMKYFKYFIVYDNYGHFVSSIYGNDLFQKYLELMTFQYASHVFNQYPTVYYFDIAAFTPDNSDLFTDLRDFEITTFFSPG